MKAKYFFSSVIALAMFALVGCDKAPQTITLSGKTMGTTYQVKYLDDGKVQQKSEQIHQGIESILKDVNAKMSTYIPTSELSLFNKNSQTDQPIAISTDLATVITEAIRLNQITEGALDITVGPIVNLWGFGPEKRVEKAPTAEQIAERKAWVGIEKLALTRQDEQHFLQKAIPQLYVDLSSIAKGFGVDKVAEYVATMGASNYLVEIGGEIRAKGKNAEGKDWQIAIEKPTLDGTRSVSQIIGLKDFAMATSGDYRNYFEENGQRFSHEIDPKTCKPIQHNLASITVLADQSMTADGLSTGLYVLGADKALAVAEQYNIPVFLIIKTEQGFQHKMSSAFEKFINQR